MYVRRLEDVLDFYLMSSARPIYFMCPVGILRHRKFLT